MNKKLKIHNNEMYIRIDKLVDLLDADSLPSKRCKKCNGSGFSGTKIVNEWSSEKGGYEGKRYYIPCSCVTRAIGRFKKKYLK